MYDFKTHYVWQNRARYTLVMQSNGYSLYATDFVAGQQWLRFPTTDIHHASKAITRAIIEPKLPAKSPLYRFMTGEESGIDKQ